MNRIIWLSFLDPTLENENAFPDHSIDLAQINHSNIPPEKREHFQVDYYIFPDGLCINIEASRLTSIYYILKGPSKEGILPFIQDIVSFCENVRIATVKPDVVMERISTWKRHDLQLTQHHGFELIAKVIEQCKRLDDVGVVDDVTDIQAACSGLASRDDDHVICYRGDISGESRLN